MTTEPVLHTVRSTDGTTIAVWRSGEGPPLVLVHGTSADHTRWETVRALLEPHATLHAVDRRGRGGSGDTETYSIEQEMDDVRVVVEAAAGAWGGPVDVLGHSYGALCALGAAERTDCIRRLALYEPPVRPEGLVPDGFLDRADALLAAGKRDELVAAFFREVVRMPEPQLDVFRTLPVWPARVAAAHTLGREVQDTMSGRLGPDRWSSLTVPTLLLDGGASPAFLRDSTAALAAVLPNARVTVLADQQHTAMDTAPDLFATSLLAFLSSAEPITQPATSRAGGGAAR